MKVTPNTDKQEEKPKVIAKANVESGIHQPKEVYDEVKKLLGIPTDEPIFIIRAQDKYSVNTLRDYRKKVRDGSKIAKPGLLIWFEEVGAVMSNFINWQRDNRNKVKEPD